MPFIQGFSGLTERERQVAILLSQGRNAKKVASLLAVSAKTVDAHRQKCYDKLGIHSVAELTRAVVEWENKKS